MGHSRDDCCSRPGDEKHHRSRDAGHEAPKRPDPLPTEQCLKQQSPHRISVGRAADTLWLDTHLDFSSVVHSESALALDMAPPFRADALIFPVLSIVADFANGWRPFVPASRCQS